MTAIPWWAPWVGAGVLVGIATVLWWWVPKWQANLLSLKISDPKERADVEDNFRKTIGQLSQWRGGFDRCRNCLLPITTGAISDT